MKSWQKWLYGLLAGCIGAGAQGVIGALGIVVGNAAGANIPQLNLKQIAVIFGSGALVAGFMYLKQSPLPPLGSTAEENSKTPPTP